MKITITGGAGFIGSNLARRALVHGHSVTIIDNLATGYIENVSELPITWVEGSINDPQAMDKAVADADSVIHLAALGSVPRSVKDPVTTHIANADGTLAVLEAARRHGVDHVVYSSSSSVYGANPALPKNEREWVRPLSPYAVSKLTAEQYVLAYQSTYGLKTLAFRFFNVYGPGQRAGHVYAAVIPTFISAAMSGEPLKINGDGSYSRDFTNVDTVCQVLLSAAENKVSAPEPINLAFGTNTTVGHLADSLEELLGEPVKREYCSPRVGDVPHSQADSSKLRELFPLVEPVDLQTGLHDTVEWFRGGARYEDR